MYGLSAKAFEERRSFSGIDSLPINKGLIEIINNKIFFMKPFLLNLTFYISS